MIQRLIPHTALCRFSFSRFNSIFYISNTLMHKQHTSAAMFNKYSKKIPGFLSEKQDLHTSCKHNKNFKLLDHVKTLLQICIDGVMKDEQKHLSSLVPTEKIHNLCNSYENLVEEEKKALLLYLCQSYGVKHDKVTELCSSLTENVASKRDEATLLLSEERLRFQLQPLYSHLFKLIGRLDGGVKFITDVRNDALTYAANSLSSQSQELRDLSNYLKNMLAIWFSVGLLKLTRITWETPADILEKIAKKEAVHQIRNWVDLKHRLGNDRRCYAFFHSSMPREPLVLLHVALTNEITAEITNIVDYSVQNEDIDSEVAKHNTAIFYSITSTQRGLQGIEFGVHMIRAVAQELQQAFPTLQQFSSLSPIPRFHNWLLGYLVQAVKDEKNIFLPNEMQALKSFFEIHQDQTLVEHIFRNISHKSWWKNEGVSNVLKSPMLRLCSFFLHEVKSRGYAFDPVANFHLQNGAMLWRINWMADPSVKGFNQSFGIMVNYRYYLDDMETNSREYMLTQHITVSQDVVNMKSSDLCFSGKPKL